MFEVYPGTEVNALWIASGRSGLSGNRVRLDDGHAFEALAQKADAPIDFVEPFLAVRVFGVLRAVALSGGF
jgi:hypothetical protein